MDAYAYVEKIGFDPGYVDGFVAGAKWQRAQQRKKNQVNRKKVSTKNKSKVLTCEQTLRMHGLECSFRKNDDICNYQSECPWQR